MSSTRLSALLDGILEAGWLAAIIVTPLLFDIYSRDVFELDKWLTLRSIALVMAAAWIIRLMEEWASRRKENSATVPLLRLTWRTPLVLVILFTAVVYLISTAFSLNPYTSLLGSFERHRGTLSILSTLVICLVIMDRMRTRAQVDRFVTTLILNSLPIALYGFVQHSGRDPLPWGGDVVKRVPSNMGNPIFVAAYMIMVVPPTLARVVDSFRSILTDEDTGTGDVLRAAAYIFTFLVQVISIWYTNSRGPLMGLLAGLAMWAFLGLLVLRRAAQREQAFRPRELLSDVGRGVGFGLGGLAASGAVAALVYLVARTVAAAGSSLPQWAALGSALLVLLGAWLAFIINGRGWRWLWLSGMTVAIVFGAGFLGINLIGPIREWSQQQPWLGRLDDVLQYESGTGMVRSLLWQQTLELILPHEPLEYPPTTTHPDAWRPDPFNTLRPLVGYGPETMFVSANRFYPPLLAHYEKRTASGDRAHNETMDTLAITGLQGFVAYLWLFGSLFYFGLRWLGILPGGRWRILFIALMVGGAVVATLATGIAIGPHFFGLAVPVGIVGGMFLFMIIRGFAVYWEPGPGPALHPRSILLMGILSAFVAHLIELQFAFSCAANRTTFWGLAGVFVVLGLRQVVDREEGLEAPPPVPPSQRPRRSRRRRRVEQARSRTVRSARAPSWLWPSLAAALIGALMLGTLAYDFVTNPEQLSDPVRIFWRSVTVIASKQPPRLSLGILMLLVLTWLSTTLLTVTQMAKRGTFREHRGEESAAGLVVLVVSLAVGAAFGLFLAGRHASIATTTVESIADALALAGYIARHITSYYLFLAGIILAGGLALTGEHALPKRWGTIAGAAVGIVLLPLVIVAVYRLNLRFIQADIVYKQGNPWSESDQSVVAIQHDQRAIELAPREDKYYNFLAMDLQRYVWTLEDAAQQNLVMQELERVTLQAQALNPLNTDHSANLARIYKTWAALPAGQEHQQLLAELSSRYYEAATTLSPNHAHLWTEWAALYQYNLASPEGFQRTIDRSLDLDAEYEQTWLLLGEVRAAQGELDEAAEAYRTALDIKPGQPQVWGVLGSIYLQLGQNEEAIEALSEALERAPSATDAWDFHRLLAIAYYQVGSLDEALLEAQLALQMAPENQRPTVEQLIQQLQQLPPLEETSQ